MLPSVLVQPLASGLKVPVPVPAPAPGRYVGAMPPFVSTPSTVATVAKLEGDVERGRHYLAGVQGRIDRLGQGDSLHNAAGAAAQAHFYQALGQLARAYGAVTALPEGRPETTASDCVAARQAVDKLLILCDCVIPQLGFESVAAALTMIAPLLTWTDARAQALLSLCDTCFDPQGALLATVTRVAGGYQLIGPSATIVETATGAQAALAARVPYVVTPRFSAGSSPYEQMYGAELYLPVPVEGGGMAVYVLTGFVADDRSGVLRGTALLRERVAKACQHVAAFFQVPPDFALPYFNGRSLRTLLVTTPVELAEACDHAYRMVSWRDRGMAPLSPPVDVIAQLVQTLEEACWGKRMLHHEQRSNFDDKNLLHAGQVTLPELYRAVHEGTGSYEQSSHHKTPGLAVHILHVNHQGSRWYIKWYVFASETWFLSVHH